MTKIGIDTVVTASGMRCSGKTLTLNILRKAFKNQPGIEIIEDHADGHEIHVVGVYDLGRRDKK